MTIPKAFLEGLIERVSLVDVVQSFVDIKKKGANWFGCCPFHTESSPSFSVSETKKFYHCFGCGANGDAIKFLMERAGLSFVEAVEELSVSVGMVIPRESLPVPNSAQVMTADQRQTFIELNERAADAYRADLAGSAKAIEFMTGHEISSNVAARFGLGYAPDSWRNLPDVFEHYGAPELLACGLVRVADERANVATRYDRFRDRILFPVRNGKGECLGFAGRSLGAARPRFLYTADSPVFVRDREVFGLCEGRQAIREARSVLVMANCMDVLALAEYGFENAVATLGADCSSTQLERLFREVDQVTFCFPDTRQGQAAARHALEVALPLATDMRTVRFLLVPTSSDVGDFVREHGSEVFGQVLADAVPLSVFLIDLATAGQDLLTPEARYEAATRAGRLWHQLPVGILRLQMVKLVGEVIGIGDQELAAIWNRSAPVNV